MDMLWRFKIPMWIWSLLLLKSFLPQTLILKESYNFPTF